MNAIAYPAESGYWREVQESRLRATWSRAGDFEIRWLRVLRWVWL